MLRLYNTMTRSVDEFKPIEPGKVSLYTCGLTVYNYAHIGNLRTYIFEDILKRVLTQAGYKVRHVMNITDVGHLVSDADEGEDKMELGAAREGRSAWEIAEFYQRAFERDIERLNIIPPDVWCKATEHIDEQIELVKTLEEKGYTYVIEGDGVYFDTSKLADYGKLARLDVEGLQAGARVKMVAGKRNPTDFALWKFSPAGQKRQMEWQSPWGIGFPGWHVECSAMAIRHLGERADIHCGGVDHVPVHHTNEIAQAEAAMGHEWVNWWMHGEWLVIPRGGEEAKMSKSGGEFLTLDLLAERGFDPLAYRYFCLNAHYRQQLAFSWDALEASASAFRRLKRSVLDLRERFTGEQPVEAHVAEARTAAEDDLNTPRVLAAMWNALRDENATDGEKYATLLEMDAVLGLGIAQMSKHRKRGDISETDVLSTDQQEPFPSPAKVQSIPLRRDGNFFHDMEELIRLRIRARKAKRYDVADAIRDKLSKVGVSLEDTPTGTVWRAARHGRE